MENSAEALKLAGFTLLFVIALSVAMMTIMQAKRTSEQIIAYSDKTNYSSTIQVDTTKQDEKGNRVVSVYDIIPTLYRYNQEKYIVLFEDKNGQPLTVYNGVVKPNSNEIEQISYLNGELETYKQAQWLISTASVKEHVDKVVKALLNESSKSYVESLHTTNNAYENNSKDNNTRNLEKTDDNTSIKVITYKQITE